MLKGGVLMVKDKSEYMKSYKAELSKMTTPKLMEEWAKVTEALKRYAAKKR